MEVTSYTLTVDGEVDCPLVLSYDELLSMPAAERSVRLLCEGGLHDIALARGVTLAHLLMLARVRGSASRAVFHCTDGYCESIPLVELIHREALLAYSMDGEGGDALGWTLRLVIPGKFGYKWAKSVERIELVAAQHELR